MSYVVQLNVVLDDTGVAMLCDFGLAKDLDTAPTGFTTATSQTARTFRYAPPERYAGGERSPKGDVYSFGCLVYGSSTSLLFREHPLTSKRLAQRS